ADILAYSVIEVASAFAPSLGALLILRAAFGFAMGGEWGVGASLAMESVPPRARGFISGLLQQGYALGYLLAAVIYYFLFDKIGWRGMFMVGVAPALIILLLRGGVAESPAFEKLRAARKTPQAPSRWTARSAPLAALTLGGLLLAIAPAVIGANGAGALWWIYLIDAPVALIGLLLIFRANWRTALWAAALMAAFNLFSHGSQDLYPTFLQRGRHLSTHVVGALAILMNFGAIAGGLAFGAWSERAGRKVAIITAAVASLVLIPLWAFSPSLAMLAAGAFFMQAMVQGAWGVVPAHLNELSPPASRGAFPGYVYQLGNLLASGCAVWQARLAEARGGDWSLALAVATGAAAIAIVLFTLLGRERRGAALG
ncbi:MAG: MFS transporter, partial [Caulobacteraceae bacterium]